ncbi:uncharacterized protein GGS22DRAFT_182975 [Annulohypoxylon maeteangense]|uniref:uncharacterized protein n=1 Tax=Annulohypoxylon maeteangense TaxID=1927788 RepID=UPI002007E582|nr:uncharacterized protein GGS22DRAFT_182975 [Annulohypoxylon maeteangense]KAI0889630.1 hypothetical protein GGS22DRAFT_182975 [Annulohypoxylon maeteangense]
MAIVDGAAARDLRSQRLTYARALRASRNTRREHPLPKPYKPRPRPAGFPFRYQGSPIPAGSANPRRRRWHGTRYGIHAVITEHVNGLVVNLLGYFWNDDASRDSDFLPSITKMLYYLSSLDQRLDNKR